MSEETKTPNVDPEFLNELKGNFNAILYLLTESIALNVRVTEVLAEKEVLSDEDVASIFAVTGDKERLTAIYQEVFQRFVNYYGAVQNTIQSGIEGSPPVATTDVPSSSAAPGENFANEETSSDGS